ncbi:MAG: TIGR00159 family protein [Ruminococcaceae bacterium]|nr:TIGR00159 family protein [Oscillospiraceae bacterium]MBQ7119941.1 diadenylate cyclase CdaA [Oscillospiraceae bacterium]
MMNVWERIVKYVTLFGIWDIIDILIVAYLIYKLICFTKRSNAGRVIKGIGLFVVITQISDSLGLKLLNFLLVNAMQLGLLALVVLFQPELRRAFEKFGSRWFTPLTIEREKDNSEMEFAISQTVDACVNLSATKTGALIVFEREILLNSYVKTGTVIDSAMNSELIKNIFYPKAPLHDGALIVQKGRGAAAGCVLPLSGNTDLSKQLGMRHRAGVGMSENSDAVVVVVSEETGAISVAIGGMLKRHLAAETLEKILKNELIPNSEETEKNNILKNLFNHIKEGATEDEAEK